MENKEAVAKTSEVLVAKVLAEEVYKDIVDLIRYKLGAEIGRIGIEKVNISNITDKSIRDLNRLGRELLPLVSNMEEKKYDLAFGSSSIKLEWMNDDRTAVLFSMSIVDEESLRRLKFRDFADEASIRADLRVFRGWENSITTDLAIGFTTVKKIHDILLLTDC